MGSGHWGARQKDATVVEHRRSIQEGRALRKSNEITRALLAAIPDLIFQIHQDGTFLDYHVADPEELYTPPEGFLGRKVADVLSPELAAKVTVAIADTLATGALQTFEYELPFADGPHQYEARMVVWGKDAILAIIRDITKLREAEKTLLEKESDFRGLADGIADPFFAFDQDLRYNYWNHASETLLGIRSEDALGRSWEEMFPDLQGSEIDQTYREVLRTRRPTSVECPYHDGQRERIFNLSIYPSGDGIAVLAKDVTESRKAQEESDRAQKLESLGLLAGGIAHDFNNLLTAILGHINLARLDATPGRPADLRLSEAEKAIGRARELTQQLLAFSKGGVPIRKPMHIGGLIMDAANFCVHGANIRCEFSIPDDTWPVEVDEGQMNQVITNLVINATQAMPDGGLIRIGVRNLTADDLSSSLLPDGRYVEITVADEGVGISKKHLNQVFDPYFTTRETGNGLGLTTCYTIVRKHDGLITVKSRPGKGTTFTVYIPASRRAPDVQSTDETVLEGHGRILVMDDEEMIRDVCCQMLAQLGYEVETARDGAEAISRYVSAKESGQPFEAVIADLTVQSGMGGKETARRLLEIDPKVKIVVSSGYSNDPVMADFRSHGFQGVMMKPYHLKHLSRVLKKVLSVQESENQE